MAHGLLFFESRTRTIGPEDTMMYGMPDPTILINTVIAIVGTFAMIGTVSASCWMGLALKD